MNLKKLLSIVTLSFAAFIAIVAVGCGGSGASGGSGTLAVRLADAPDPTITELNVTISRVQAHVGSEWIDVAVPNATYNLLDLTQQDIGLGAGVLPAGTYTQIRVFIDSATVVDADGTHNVNVPSAAQTGLKLNVNYTIQPNVVTTLLLDFNVDKSLNKLGNGQYQLQPVIPAVVQILSGTITGTVSDGVSNLQGAAIRAFYTAGSNYAINTEVNSSTTIADGTFKIWALLPGTYRLEVSYIDPDDSTEKTATVADVSVSANANTDVGTIVVTTPSP